MRSKFLEPSVVSRDNNLYVVGDISILYVKKYRSAVETNNYQVCELVRGRYELREQTKCELGGNV